MQPQNINPNENKTNLVTTLWNWLKSHKALWPLPVGAIVIGIVLSASFLVATQGDDQKLAADKSDKDQSGFTFGPWASNSEDSTEKKDSKKSDDDKKSKDKKSTKDATDKNDTSATTQKPGGSTGGTTPGSSNGGDTGGDTGGSTGGGTTPPPPSTPTPPPTPPTSGGFPTSGSTGPRYASTQTSGSVTTSYDGQVINRRTINGRLLILHNNVTVRDTTVNATGHRYMVQADDTASGNCPTNLKFEYVEINGAGGDPDDAALYASNCGYVFDHGYIHNVGRGIISSGNITVTNSYIHTPRTYSGSHRNAILSNGGSNMSFIHNTLYCENSGCSSAVSMYGDFRPIDNVLLQNNLLATTGSYCFYGASGSDDPYEDSNLRIIGNHFSSRYRASCGIYGAIANFDNNVRGNQCYGNVWHETGASADSEC